jgi:glycosyltransferase involved in cell wall biosynthesis
MNLLILCDEYPPGPHGGIGTAIQIVARNFQKNGHKVIVAGVYDSDYPGDQIGQDQGVIVIRKRIKQGKLFWLRKRIVEYYLIKECIKVNNIDILEGADWKGAFAFWPKLSIPVVVRLNGSQLFFSKELNVKSPWLSRLLEKKSLEYANNYISSSNYCFEVTKSILHNLKQFNGVVYNPSERVEKLPPFSNREKGKVVFTGTITPKKGILELLDAWPLVLKDADFANLHIYGKDTNQESKSILKSKLKLFSKDILGTIHYHGRVDREEILTTLKSANVGVFPSYSETFGYSAVESMLNGCPTIYTKRSVGKEIIPNENIGLLVTPSSKEEIASSILKILLDEPYAELISKNGFEYSNSSFTIETQIEKNIEIYQTIINAYNYAERE